MRSLAKYKFVAFIKAFIITTIVVSLLGYVDFITGDISIEILYILSIGLVSWFTNPYVGILCAIEIVIVKISADFYGQIEIGTNRYLWNSFNSILIYIVICVLVRSLKKALIS